MNNQMFSKIVTLLFVFLCQNILAYDTWVDPETSIEWRYYLFDADGLVVYGATQELAGDVTVPGRIANREVKGIGTEAFQNNGKITSVTLPDSIVSIFDYAFDGCANLATVTMPADLIKVGKCAFEYSGIECVVLPAGVTTIQNLAFCGCANLTNLTLSTGLREIGSSAFAGCSALSNVDLPNGITNIAMGAFSQCTKLSSITLPLSLTTVSRDTFNWCTGLECVVIPTNVVRIEYSAFRNCTALKSVTVPSCVTSISETFPSSYETLIEAIIQNDRTSIDVGLFAKCYGLESLTIPCSVTAIAGGSFDVCSKLKNVEIPPSITTLQDAFPNSSSISHVKLNGDRAAVGDYMFHGSQVCDVLIPPGVVSIGRNAFSGCPLVSVKLPETVSSIGANAFFGCESLVDINIPASVTNIGSMAFGRCPSLGTGFVVRDQWLLWVSGIVTNAVEIPHGIKGIAGGAFFSNVHLKSVTFPPSLMYICDEAFKMCFSLSDLVVPRTVESVGTASLEGLECVYFEGEPPEGVVNAKISKDATVFYCAEYESKWLPVIETYGWSSVTPYSPVVVPVFSYDCVGNEAVITGVEDEQSLQGDLILPASIEGRMVTSVGSEAFMWCDGITHVVIPSSITNIGSCAFRGCGELEAIIVAAANATYCADDGVLFNRDKTELVCYPAGRDGPYKIPEGVTNVLSDAFGGSRLLTCVFIPSTVANIGVNAFSFCSNLAEFEVEDNSMFYSSYEGLLLSKDGQTLVSGINGDVSIPSCVSNIWVGAFYGFENLTSVKMSSGVTKIHENAFCSCFNLTNVVVGKNVQEIGEGAFELCESLASIVIPSAVVSVGRNVFSECTSLMSLDFEGEPPDGIADAAINTGAAIRYNSLHQSKWLPIAVACGWTNAVPYEPAGPKPDGGPYTENVDGVLWKFMVKDGVSVVGPGEYVGRAISQDVSGEIFIPEFLGERPVGKIENAAFYGCLNIESVRIPTGVTNIGARAFSYCNVLSEIKVDNKNPMYVSDNGYVLTKNKKVLVCGLNSGAEIPATVESICDCAFEGCSLLQTVSIPQSVTNIGSYAFESCSSLRNICLPSGVICVGRSAFENCSSLTNVSVQANLRMLGRYVFASCRKLSSFSVADDNQTYKAVNGLMLSKNGQSLIWGVNGDVKIPFGVTEISIDAFSGFKGMTSVDMPDSLNSIADWAFNYCVGITNITFPASIKSVGAYSFYGCSNLNAVDFEGAPPAGVAKANLKNNAAIRYNVAFKDKWMPVVEECGWTNAKAYSPGAPVLTDQQVISWVASELAVEFAKPGESIVGYLSRFEAKFGSDISEAFFKETGKSGPSGEPLYVWHDFVAGTDPLDENSKFTAIIRFDDSGNVKVEYSPVLDATKTEKRIYSTYGKNSLDEADWFVVPSGAENNYKFFKVSVELK